MFWGLVVGDCLGSPVQFMKKDEHPHITEMEPCQIFGTPPGYWTDDSSLAFCVAASFVELGKYDLRDIADRFARWIETGYWSSLPSAFDIGGTTQRAIGEIIARGSLRNGAESAQGNGSIMRLAPSYIMNHGSDDTTTIREISALTHASSVVEKTVDQMVGILDDHIAGRAASVKSLYGTREEVNNSGWVVSTLNAALWAFEHTNSFEEGMIEAVNLAGDADTIGAVYGQIAGAWYGFEEIPKRWLDAVKDNDKIDGLIESLLRLKGLDQEKE